MQMESHLWLAYAAVKEEPMEKNEDAISFVMGNVTGDTLEVIEADDMSSVAQEVLLVYPSLGADNAKKLHQNFLYAILVTATLHRN
jgi:hypothetical protein